MEQKIVWDLHCFQCSLQFDKKSIYDMHTSILHGYKNVARSIFGTQIKQEPEDDFKVEVEETNYDGDFPKLDENPAYQDQAKVQIQQKLGLPKTNNFRNVYFRFHIHFLGFFRTSEKKENH